MQDIRDLLGLKVGGPIHCERIGPSRWVPRPPTRLWNARVPSSPAQGGGTRHTIRFPDEMDCSILSSHRTIRPFCLHGGEGGELGKTEVRCAGGQIETMTGCDQSTPAAGEAVIVTTPTGGGYGA